MRHVIVLGAGASKSDDAPLQFELLRDYFLAEQSNLHTVMNQGLTRFFAAFYGIDVKSVDAHTSFPTFEEVLGTLELALARNENFRIPAEPTDVWDQARMRECREYMVTLICTILERKLGSGPGMGDTCHKRLVSKFLGAEDVCFISLNYDLLIDNAIADARRIVDYGITFANPLPPTPSPIGLYKLHGSLNWLRCPICGALTNTGSEKGAAYPTEQRQRCQAPNCDAETTPIVIPPTFFKVMSDFHLQQIWHAAENQLRTADRIYFCGYSLPDADMHIRYLLKRAEVNRKSAPEVYVINNHTEKSEDDNRRERQRYRCLFRDSAKVLYSRWSFQDFAADPLGIAAKPREEVEWRPTALERAAGPPC